MRLDFDVSLWNLGLVLTLSSAACGSASGETGGTDGNGGGAETGEPSTGPDPDTDETDGPSAPECVTEEDCGGSFYACIDGQCVDQWDDCNYYDCGDTEDLGETEDTDGPPSPDCVDDFDCDASEWCDVEGEEPACSLIPLLEVCESDALDLAFSEPLPVSGEVLSFDLVGPPGAETLIVSTDTPQVVAFDLAGGTSTSIALEAPSYAVSGGDLDGDGDVDVVVGRDTEARVHIRIGPGTFESGSVVNFGGSAWVGVAMTTGLDAALLAVRDGRVFRADPNGAGGYEDAEPITPVGGGATRNVVVASFDDQGGEDVAWTGLNSESSLGLNFRMDGGERRSSVEARPGTMIRGGDGDGDGIADLLAFWEGGGGYVRVDVVLPDPVADGAGRALLLLDGTSLVGHASADVDDDGRADAVVLLDGPNENSSLAFGRALLSDAPCESTVSLDARYFAVDTLQHPDGSGWIVLRGGDGFVAAPL